MPLPFILGALGVLGAAAVGGAVGGLVGAVAGYAIACIIEFVFLMLEDISDAIREYLKENYKKKYRKQLSAEIMKVLKDGEYKVVTGILDTDGDVIDYVQFNAEDIDDDVYEGQELELYA